MTSGGWVARYQGVTGAAVNVTGGGRHVISASCRTGKGMVRDSAFWTVVE